MADRKAPRLGLERGSDYRVVSVSTIEFVIPGRAVPRSRPRVRYGQRAYYPERYEVWRTTAKLIARSAAQYTLALWEGPVRVKARFYYKGRADADNLMSAVFDVLTGSVLRDDRQVTEFHGYKIPDKDERVEVRVELLEEAIK